MAAPVQQAPPAPVAAAPVKAAKGAAKAAEPQGQKADKKADNKRKHAEAMPAQPQQQQAANGSNKKAKVDTSSAEIQLLKEELRKQQEMFERRLSSLAQEMPQVQHPIIPPFQQMVPIQKYVPAQQQAVPQVQQLQPVPVAVAPPSAGKTKPQQQQQEKTPKGKAKAAVPAPHSLLGPAAHAGDFTSQANTSLPLFLPATFAPVLPMAATVVTMPVASADSDDDDEQFLFDAVNHCLNTTTPVKPAAAPAAAADDEDSDSDSSPDGQPTPNTPNRREKKDKAGYVPSALPEDSLFLPLEQAAAKEEASAPTKQAFDFSQVNLPGIDWNALMQVTFNHKRYAQDYTFDKDPFWIQARPHGEWCKNVAMPKVIAVDCEMCECADPVTGARDKNSLIRLSVVNGLDPAQVFIDTLVAPSLPIVDARTRIHGITEEDLGKMKVTMRHAQAALLNIITDDTIIIGHSVCNDLKALRLDHKRCIDTAFLCPLENDHNPNHLMGLRAITEKIIGVKLPDNHDSVQDARASLLVAAYVATNGPPRNLSLRDEHPQLMVHRIPQACSEEHLHRMLVAYTGVFPTKVSSIAHSGHSSSTEPTGKAHVFYSTQKHADLAFDSLFGVSRPDKSKRPQKRVYLKKGGYICVRK